MQFNVVMSLNDRAAIGALAAIKDQGVTDKIAIYGVDGSPDIKISWPTPMIFKEREAAHEKRRPAQTLDKVR